MSQVNDAQESTVTHNILYRTEQQTVINRPSQG